MEALTTYKAADGSRFDSAEACLDYERLCAQIESIMEPLGKRDVQGPRYYQHHPPLAKSVAKALTMLAVAIYVPNRAHEEWSPYSILGRFIDDGNKRCLQRAWGRLQRIDVETGREYEQPYFRLHPNEATEPQL